MSSSGTKVSTPVGLRQRFSLDDGRGTNDRTARERALTPLKGPCVSHVLSPALWQNPSLEIISRGSELVTARAGLDV